MENKPTKYTDLLHVVTSSKMFNVVSLDPLVAEGRIAMPYRYFPGSVASRFFVELRDHQKIFGIRCTTCDIVYVPPEATCGRCFEQLEEWIEVGTQGFLETYTLTHYQLPIHPGPVPLMHGLIKLDGADTGFVHLLGEVNLQSIKIGMRMEAVFKEKREGTILDILYFRPAK